MSESSLCRWDTSQYWTEGRNWIYCKDFFFNWNLQTRHIIRPELFFRHGKTLANPKSFLTHSFDISAPTQTELFYCQAISVIMSSVWEWLQKLTKNMSQNKIPTDLCWISRHQSTSAIKILQIHSNTCKDSTKVIT